MQKKLLAVAVAGALGAPAVALAQSSNSSVNIYGVFYAEYAKINQGNTAPSPGFPAGSPLVDYDHLQNPGSAIGFRGEEKLGSGLSAWFQCESSADFRGVNGDGFCTRNSALGLKGGFGNVFMGNWDTPFKRVQEATGSGDTGVFGSAFVLMNNSTTVNSGAASQGVFKRRQRNSVNYDSPNFGGFQVMGAFTTLNTQSSTLATATGNKPRVWSLGGKYANGPLSVYLAYEKHKDITGAAAARDDKGWVLGGTYTFANNLKLGALWSRQRMESGTALLPTEAKVSTWHIGMDWMISGPHGVRAAVSSANNMKGNSLAAIGQRPAALNTAPGVVGFISGDTGARLWQVRYVHQLSKRTELTLGYVKLKNDRFAAYQLGGVSANGPGEDQSAFAMGMYHRF